MHLFRGRRSAPGRRVRQPGPRRRAAARVRHRGPRRATACHHADPAHAAGAHRTCLASRSALQPGGQGVHRPRPGAAHPPRERRL